MMGQLRYVRNSRLYVVELYRELQRPGWITPYTPLNPFDWHLAYESD